MTRKEGIETHKWEIPNAEEIVVDLDIWNQFKELLLELYDRRCARCGAATSRMRYDEPLEIDHIVPKSLGGPDHPINMQILCRACNQAKLNTIKYFVPQGFDHGRAELVILTFSLGWEEVFCGWGHIMSIATNPTVRHLDEEYGLDGFKYFYERNTPVEAASVIDSHYYRYPFRDDRKWI